MTASQLRLFNAARIKANLRRTEPARSGPTTVHIDKIKQLRAQQDEELAKLEKALALEELWPNLFNGPKGVISSWRGKPLPASVGTGFALTLRITNAHGMLRDFAQHDVPEVLWPSPTYGQF